MASMFSSFFNPGDAYKKAGRAAEEGWQQARKYEEPFWQSGVNQIDPLNQARQRLMNPMDLQNEWSNAYETSPYAQRMLAMNRGQGLESASSMGLMGSSAALNNINRGAADIMGEDRRQFLTDLMQKYLAGIGLGTHLYDTGAQTGGNLAQQRIGHGENMAAMQYGRHAAPGALFENLLNTYMNFNKMPDQGGGGGQGGGMPPYAMNALMAAGA